MDKVAINWYKPVVHPRKNWAARYWGQSSYFYYKERPTILSISDRYHSRAKPAAHNRLRLLHRKRNAFILVFSNWLSWKKLAQIASRHEHTSHENPCAPIKRRGVPHRVHQCNLLSTMALWTRPKLGVDETYRSGWIKWLPILDSKTPWSDSSNYEVGKCKPSA